MTNDIKTFMLKIALDEVAGKNRAVHAYDKMLWTVRTGYLTLLFAAWGLILSSLSRDLQALSWNAVIAKAQPLLQGMVGVSICIAVAGFTIDLNYARRKFRVIAALNAMMKLLIEHHESPTDIFASELAAEYWSVSGDTRSRSYASVSGYRGEFTVSTTIFFLPLVGVAATVLLLSLPRSSC